MAQGVLGFQYEGEESATGMTALAGLPVYLDLFAAMGLSRSIEGQVRVRPAQGWSDAQMITSLVLLNLAGGESVDDLRVLEADTGFAAVLRETENHGLSRRERRALKRRWRKERQRAAPSPSA
ncbi:MAG: IS1380 family transposase, partial [bacterium]